MKLGFTEFSYGYAFTENLFRSSENYPSKAPKFPNLVEEGQLGYDVEFDLPGLPLFFQFKLPSLMVRNTAREISNFQIPNLSTPYFRMPLMQRNLSNQHARLIQLESRNHNRVFYASTLLKSVKAFNEAYANADVHMQSALFSPREIGKLQNNGQHSVVYTTSSSDAWFCSEPKKIEAKRFQDLEKSVRESLSQVSDYPLHESIKRIRKTTIYPISGRLKRAEKEIRKRVSKRIGESRIPISDPDTMITIVEFHVAKELARIGLGVEMVIAQPRR